MSTDQQGHEKETVEVDRELIERLIFLEMQMAKSKFVIESMKNELISAVTTHGITGIEEYLLIQGDEILYNVPPEDEWINQVARDYSEFTK